MTNINYEEIIEMISRGSTSPYVFFTSDSIDELNEIKDSFDIEVVRKTLFDKYGIDLKTEVVRKHSVRETRDNLYKLVVEVESENLLTEDSIESIKAMEDRYFALSNTYEPDYKVYCNIKLNREIPVNKPTVLSLIKNQIGMNLKNSDLFYEMIYYMRVEPVFDTDSNKTKSFNVTIEKKDNNE